MKQYYKLKLALLACLSFGLSSSWSQITTLDYTGSMVSYTVPPGVTNISIEALGGQGASGQVGRVGGQGAKMYGEFSVTPGDNLIVVVGGMGQGQNSGSNGGGGGGSFVVLDDPAGPYTIAAGPFAGTNVTPLIVAGGGGGTRASAIADGNPGVIGNMGTSSSGSGSSGGGIPVTAPTSGGIAASSSWGSGGGGFVGNGGNDGSSGCGGSSFLNGAAGGSGCGSSGDNAAGGFGSGGQGRGSWGGGGGGGWSGGQGGFVAGGGGSYNVGAAQDNVSGFNSGDGQVIITVLCMSVITDIPVTGVCIGEELSLYAESTTGGTITWDGGVDNGVPFAPPLGTTLYTMTSSSPDDCNFEIEISASEIPDIVANSDTEAACEGSVVTVFGTGGDTYTWTGTGDIDPTDGVPFPAESGSVTYTVIGSILGCEGPADEITLVGAPQPDVVATASPIEVCLGESYTLTGSGAVTYNWGGGIADGSSITQEFAGTYNHVLIGLSDVGCGDTTNVSVTVHPAAMVYAGADVTVCEGDEVTLNATGADMYSWSPMATNGVPFAPESTSIYTVTGTDANGCTDDDEVLVTVVEVPYITASTVVDEFFGYDGSIDITVAGGSGSYTYLWSNGAITQDISSLPAGVYTVNIDDITIAKGQCPSTATFTLASFVSVEDNDSNQLNAYPNPTNDNLTITFNGQFNYSVINTIGEVMFNGSAVDQEELSLKSLANGTYIIKVTSGDSVHNLQVVKQ